MEEAEQHFLGIDVQRTRQVFGESTVVFTNGQFLAPIEIVGDAEQKLGDGPQLFGKRGLLLFALGFVFCSAFHHAWKKPARLLLCLPRTREPSGL